MLSEEELTGNDMVHFQVKTTAPPITKIQHKIYSLILQGTPKKVVQAENKGP